MCVQFDQNEAGRDGAVTIRSSFEDCLKIPVVGREVTIVTPSAAEWGVSRASIARL